MKPICYMDLAGVLFYTPSMQRYGSKPAYDLRPHTIALLKTVHDCGYELRFLSGDKAGAQALTILLSQVFADNFPNWDIERIPNCAYNEEYFTNHSGGGNKASFVDGLRNFVWIEDGLAKPDRDWLAFRGWGDRHFEVNPFFPDELLKVERWIKNHPFSNGGKAYGQS